MNGLTPALDLHSHPDANNVTYNQRATYIDTTIAAIRCGCCVLKAQLRQQVSHKTLKIFGIHLFETLKQCFAHLLVVLLDFRCNPIRKPAREPNYSSPMSNEARSLATLLIAFSLLTDNGIECCLWCCALSGYQTLIKG